MPRGVREPRWLNKTIVDCIHTEQIREHGGLAGIRDDNALESALARPRNKWTHGEERDIASLAAAYGFAFVTSHPYSDGNKRIGFLAIVTFLGINGYDFDTSDSDVVTEILLLAAGKVSENQLADWVRQRTKPIKK
jgi:death-on-curing protein